MKNIDYTSLWINDLKIKQYLQEEGHLRKLANEILENILMQVIVIYAFHKNYIKQ